MLLYSFHFECPSLSESIFKYNIRRGDFELGAYKIVECNRPKLIFDGGDPPIHMVYSIRDKYAEIGCKWNKDTRLDNLTESKDLNHLMNFFRLLVFNELCI